MKKNKNNKLIEVLKHLKKPLIILSIVFNILFFLITIVGCVQTNKNKKSQVNAIDETLNISQVYRSNKRGISNFNKYSNSSLYSYDLTTIKPTDFVGYFGANDYQPLSSNIILYGINGYVFTDQTQMYFRYNVQNGGVPGNFIEISVLDNNLNRIVGRYYEFQSNWSWHYLDLEGTADYNTDDGFYVVYNVNASVDNGFGIDALFKNYFNSIEYNDYSLNANWNVFELVPFTTPFVSGGGAFIRRTIASNIIFGVNGLLYDSIIAQYTNSSGTAVYYEDIDKVKVLENECYLDFVAFRSEAMNRFDIVYMPEDHIYEKNDQPQHSVVYGKFKLRDANFLNIRLFGINVTNNVINVFNYSSTTETYYGNGEFGDVFKLFSNGFNGLDTLFKVQLLPGITIGILLFLPLVATIVFALIKVLKK